MEGMNMGECFMGRRSKLTKKPESQVPWARIEEMNWNKKEYNFNIPPL